MNTLMRQDRATAIQPPPLAEVLDPKAFQKSEFTGALPNWSREDRPQAVAIIPFESAIRFINCADPGEDHIDIPLVFDLAVICNRDEMLEFSYSIHGQREINTPSPAKDPLLSKIIGDHGFEFKVEERRVAHPDVYPLLNRLRAIRPEMQIDLMGKWLPDGSLDSPDYFIRVRPGAKAA